MCGNMADIQPVTAEIRRGKKKKKQDENMYVRIMLRRAAINYKHWMSATEASADVYLYCNCTILSNFLHRIRDDIADRFVAV